MAYLQHVLFWQDIHVYSGQFKVFGRVFGGGGGFYYVKGSLVQHVCSVDLLASLTFKGRIREVTSAAALGSKRLTPGCGAGLGRW